jgi:hypothetical protein
MATSSVLNIITFILTTAFYYLLLKPTLTYDIMNNTEEYKYYTKNYYKSLGTYLALVLIVQFIMNTTIVTAKCGGGSLKTNILSAAAYTFFPWTLIFGVMMVVLVMYPGFKSAFSDVIGYFYVSSSANKVLTELLIDKNIQQEMDESGATLKEKEDLQNAADAIIKICGNTSILINQIVPSNFVNYWSLLNPLMKQRFQIDSPETTSKRNQLFDLVVMRDTIGEMMWYLYTGILLTSIVQMKISTTPCYLSPKQMEQNYQEFLKKEDQAQAKSNTAQSTVYTITN